MFSAVPTARDSSLCVAYSGLPAAAVLGRHARHCFLSCLPVAAVSPGYPGLCRSAVDARCNSRGVILPLGLLGVAVVQEAATLYKRLETGDLTVQEPLQMLEHLLSVVTQYLGRWGIETQNLTQSLAGATVTVSRFVGTQALNLGQDVLRLSVMFALMLYLLFFFLRDGPQIVTTILYTLPLGNTRARRLFAHFATVSRATLKGTLIVALVQGLLGGILFAIVGINAAVLWGALMALLSLLPALGSALIWVPAAGILLATGHIAKACIVLG